jgi:hypothetical protein
MFRDLPLKFRDLPLNLNPASKVNRLGMSLRELKAIGRVHRGKMQLADRPLEVRLNLPPVARNNHGTDRTTDPEKATRDNFSLP